MLKNIAKRRDSAKNLADDPVLDAHFLERRGQVPRDEVEVRLVAAKIFDDAAMDLADAVGIVALARRAAREGERHEVVLVAAEGDHVCANKEDRQGGVGSHARVESVDGHLEGRWAAQAFQERR